MRTDPNRTAPRRRREQPAVNRVGRMILGAVAATAVAAMAMAAAAALAAAPKAPPGWEPGWLAPPASYLGRYNLTASDSTSGAANKGVEGQLTLFIQVAFPGKPGVPSGIISLHSKKETEVFYLTDLDHDGMQRLSLVHGGAFVAPPTGSFTVSTLGHGVLAGALKQKGLAPQVLTFKRFSTNPAP